MSDAEPIDLTHKVLPTGEDDEARRHVWGAPPPGAGRSTDATCRRCGQRRSVVGNTSPCPGQASQAVTETLHEYDPFQ